MTELYLHTYKHIHRSTKIYKHQHNQQTTITQIMKPRWLPIFKAQTTQESKHLTLGPQSRNNLSSVKSISEPKPPSPLESSTTFLFSTLMPKMHPRNPVLYNLAGGRYAAPVGAPPRYTG